MINIRRKLKQERRIGSFGEGLVFFFFKKGASLVAQPVKNLSAMQKNWV